jgi:hypothetical protein
MARPSLWWLLGAAILGGIAALAFDRALSAMLAGGVPFSVTATALPTREPPVVVVLPTTVNTSVPAPGDGARVGALQDALVQQGGLLLVARAERHTALAAEALRWNDAATADRELVAARAALDSAFGLLSEDLKQVIDGQRREVGRMRSELQINPEGMDQRLRAAQDLLLGLIVPPAP